MGAGTGWGPCEVLHAVLAAPCLVLALPSNAEKPAVYIFIHGKEWKRGVQNSNANRLVVGGDSPCLPVRSSVARSEGVA